MSDKQSHRQRRPHKNNKYNSKDDTATSNPNNSNNTERSYQRPPSSSRPLSQNKRRKQAAISLASFSSKKGHDRAIVEYKKRKDEKFQKNAVLLREYQRAMKSEGYVGGRGASRKRVDERTVADGDDEDDGGGRDGDAENEELAERHPRKKRRKADPLHYAKKEAELRQAEKLEMESQKKADEKTEGQKQKSRKVRARKLMKRTRRGQPVMKNVIGDMLSKIKSDM
mmetsp:Transcript_33935/g.64581  ORF Transcript_33935/g.64581 Transcript_33935/m.64581 type:complete len:226 (+) Transcript_33935:263-940(+)|eukprot:CAMPEP_0201667588 /NCGR_PEP_ID=MMETSP0494-20130426/15726_1 /ASSEMBLY_ACC=CAM_ASM_000839 /TAXON_ID=420259 /ORGANISM="Thalassiosira gravida, Strain GMp14c1" /LENGTH=225 /DNA_ID=CAMNT_0048147633 /DNA_START=206 /DNA_END=883 /DNA_ORIENTATION=-